MQITQSAVSDNGVTQIKTTWTFFLAFCDVVTNAKSIQKNFRVRINKSMATISVEGKKEDEKNGCAAISKIRTQQRYSIQLIWILFSKGKRSSRTFEMFNNDICIHWVGRKKFTQLKVQIDSRPTTVDREYLQYDRNQIRSPKRLISFKRNRQTKILVPPFAQFDQSMVLLCVEGEYDQHVWCAHVLDRICSSGCSIWYIHFSLDFSFVSFISIVFEFGTFPFSLSSIRICPLNVWWRRRRDGDKKYFTSNKKV